MAKTRGSKMSLIASKMGPVKNQSGFPPQRARQNKKRKRKKDAKFCGRNEMSADKTIKSGVCDSGAFSDDFGTICGKYKTNFYLESRDNYIFKK